MIRINQLKLPVDHGKQDLLKKAAKLLKIPQERIRKLTIIQPFFYNLIDDSINFFI